MNDEMNKDYNMYRERFYERYWDTRENHAWYSLPVSTRAWLTLRKVREFWSDCWPLWLCALPLFLLFNASHRSRKSTLLRLGVRQKSL